MTAPRSSQRVIALVAAVCMLLVAVSCTSPEPTSTDLGAAGVLFVIDAPSSVIKAEGDRYRLTIPEGENVVWFTERPARLAGALALDEWLATQWERDGFIEDPPNAALVVNYAGTDRIHVVELIDPKIGEQDVSFALVVLDGDDQTHAGRTHTHALEEGSMGRTELFIDSVTCDIGCTTTDPADPTDLADPSDLADLDTTPATPVPIAPVGPALTTPPTGSDDGWVADASPSAGLLTDTIARPGPPTLVSFDPASALAGSTVQVFGTNLGGVTAVAFNGVAATSFIITSPTTVLAVLPSAITSGPVSVSTPQGSATSSASFMPQSPTVSSLSPASARTGESVTIAGTNLTGTTTVRFNGVEVKPSSVTAQSVTAVVPVSATTGTVSVMTPNGLASTTQALTVTSAVVTGFAPDIGAPGATVVVRGGNLTGATRVTLNGLAMAFRVVSTSEISATVPPNSTTGVIVVTTPAGTVTTSQTFGVNPRVTAMTPNPIKAGQTLTITGANLADTASITFAGSKSAAHDLIIDSATSIRVIVPPDASTGALTIVAAGPVTTSSLSIAPLITDIVPARAATGTKVQVVGSGFTGATAVKLGTSTAVFTVVSSNIVEFTVPASATSNAVSVTTPSGTGTSTSTITVGGAIAAVTPTVAGDEPSGSTPATNVPASLTSVTPDSLRTATSVDLGVASVAINSGSGSVTSDVYTGSGKATVGKVTFDATLSYTSSTQWQVTATGLGTFTVGPVTLTLASLGGSITAATGTTTWTLTGRLGASASLVPSKITILGAPVTIGVRCPTMASSALCGSGATAGRYLRMDAVPTSVATSSSLATGASVSLGGPVPAQTQIPFRAALNLTTGAFDMATTFVNTAVADLVTSGMGPTMSNLDVRVAFGDESYARLSGAVTVASGSANNGFDVQLRGDGKVTVPFIGGWNSSFQAQLVEGGLVVVGTLNTARVFGGAAMNQFAYFDAQPSTDAVVLGSPLLVPAHTMLFTGSMNMPVWLSKPLGLPQEPLGAYATMVSHGSMKVEAIIPVGVELPPIPDMETVFERAVIGVDFEWFTTTLPTPGAFTFSADGTVSIKNGPPVAASLKAVIGSATRAGEIELQLTVTGTEGRAVWPNMFGVSNFDLDTFALSVGITPEPPFLSLGLAGKGRLPAALKHGLNTDNSAPIQFVANLSVSTPCLEVTIGSPGNTVPVIALPTGVNAFTATFASLKASVRGCAVGQFEVPIGVQIGADAKIMGTNVRFSGLFDPTLAGPRLTPTLWGWAELRGSAPGGGIKWDARVAFNTGGWTLNPFFQIRGGVVIGNDARVELSGECTLTLTLIPSCDAKGIGAMSVGGLTLDMHVAATRMFSVLSRYEGDASLKFAGVSLQVSGEWTQTVSGLPAVDYRFAASGSFSKGVIDEIGLTLYSNQATSYLPRIDGHVSGRLGGVFEDALGAKRFRASGPLTPELKRIRFNDDLKVDLGVMTVDAIVGFDMCLQTSCLGKVNARFNVKTIYKVDFSALALPFHLHNWSFSASASSSFSRSGSTGNSWGGLKGSFSGTGRIAISSSPSLSFSASARAKAYVGAGGKWNYTGTVGASVDSRGKACIRVEKKNLCV